MAYIFGAHKKKSLWQNFEQSNQSLRTESETAMNPEVGFVLEDRFCERRFSISKREFSDLLTLTLANWLEQRDRVAPKYRNLAKDKFFLAEPYLPKIAFKAFQAAYGIS